MSSVIRLFLMFALLVIFAVQVDATEDKQETRLITVGGSITEIMFALGAQANIVASDTSSSYPSEAQQLPKVGYYRQLSVEGVLSMQPTRLFAAKGVGPASVLKQLENTGVDIHVFEQPRTVEGLLSLINEVGEAANLRDNARLLATDVEAQLAKFDNISHTSQVRAVFLMSASDRGLMAAGSDTVPNLVMEIAGLENPYSSINGFQPVSVESFLSIAPTHVLIASHRTDGLSVSELCKLAVLKQWAASQGCNLYIVDPLLFLGMTPRLPIAVQEFAGFVAPTSATHKALAPTAFASSDRAGHQ